MLKVESIIYQGYVNQFCVKSYPKLCCVCCVPKQQEFFMTVRRLSLQFLLSGLWALLEIFDALGWHHDTVTKIRHRNFNIMWDNQI